MLIRKNSKAVNSGVLALVVGAVVSVVAGEAVETGEAAAVGEDLHSSVATIVDGAGKLQQDYAKTFKYRF